MLQMSSAALPLDPPVPQPNTAAVGPGAVEDPSPYSSEAFWRLLHQAAWSAAGVHVLFLALFLALNATSLAAVNVVSVSLFVGVTFMLRRGHRRLAAHLMLGEIIVHACLAVLLIGWDSGFHYYLLVSLPVFFMSRERSATRKWRIALGMVALYCTMRGASQVLQPVHALPTVADTMLLYFNIASSMLLLAQLSFIYYRLITRSEEHLHRLATTDPLTGLSNRRSWLEQARQVQSTRGLMTAGGAVILGDIDHFKSINDRFGHDAGDEVLQQVARLLRTHVRAGDTVARWGGEEFIVLLPGAGLGDARSVAEMLRSHVATLRVPQGPWATPVTMTLGVAVMVDGTRVEDVIRQADQALYRGKSEGRNRVVSADDLPSP
jgi:diguanylate cyclase